jgi:hypothetical protein
MRLVGAALRTDLDAAPLEVGPDLSVASTARAAIDQGRFPSTGTSDGTPIAVTRATIRRAASNGHFLESPNVPRRGAVHGLGVKAIYVLDTEREAFVQSAGAKLLLSRHDPPVRTFGSSARSIVARAFVEALTRGRCDGARQGFCSARLCSLSASCLSTFIPGMAGGFPDR